MWKWMTTAKFQNLNTLFYQWFQQADATTISINLQSKTIDQVVKSQMESIYADKLYKLPFCISPTLLLPHVGVK